MVSSPKRSPIRARQYSTDHKPEADPVDAPIAGAESAGAERFSDRVRGFPEQGVINFVFVLALIWNRTVMPVWFERRAARHIHVEGAFDQAHLARDLRFVERLK